MIFSRRALGHGEEAVCQIGVAAALVFKQPREVFDFAQQAGAAFREAFDVCHVIAADVFSQTGEAAHDFIRAIDAVLARGEELAELPHLHCHAAHVAAGLGGDAAGGTAGRAGLFVVFAFHTTLIIDCFYSSRPGGR